MHWSGQVLLSLSRFDSEILLVSAELILMFGSTDCQMALAGMTGATCHMPLIILLVQHAGLGVSSSWRWQSLLFFFFLFTSTDIPLTKTISHG